MKNFVTFEGIDGSGKSTVSKRVEEKLVDKGFDVVLTAEPTDSTVGRFVQQCIRENADPSVTSFAFIADRIQHCKKISQWLEQGKIVLCDRFSESTYAYQAVQLKDVVDDPILWLKDIDQGKVLIPQRTFLFDVSSQEAMSRICSREELVPFEKVDFLKEVRKKYLEICRGPRFLVLDSTDSVDSLVERCCKDILEE